MTDTIDEAPSAEELAWEATRAGLTMHDAEHRKWFEDIASFIAERWPDDGMVLDVPGDDEAERILELEGTVATLLEALELELDDDGEVEAIKSAVAARLELERLEGTKDATVPSRANTAQRKALRLLVDGRLELQRVEIDGAHAGLIVAECKGDSGDLYTLGYDPHRQQWRCTCPELRGGCSHIAALKMVTAAPRPPTRLRT